MGCYAITLWVKYYLIDVDKIRLPKFSVLINFELKLINFHWSSNNIHLFYSKRTIRIQEVGLCERNSCAPIRDYSGFHAWNWIEILRTFLWMKLLLCLNGIVNIDAHWIKIRDIVQFENVRWIGVLCMCAGCGKFF